MDVPNLAVILHAALSPNPDERKAAERTLDEIQHAPQHLVRLLQIVVDNNCDIAVRQVASIQFKNYVAKYWFHASRDVQPKISPADMDVVRNNILNFITQVPPLLRVQLAECLKTIVQSDYPKHWPHLLNWVKHNLKNKQVYGALFVLQILARKYEFMSEGERTPLYRIVGETFPQLLIIFKGMLQINNPSIEIAELIKLICKIFWSSTYMEIPNQLLDPNVMGAWIVLFVNLLERSVPVGGQPTDPELRKSWGWWKVKKWTVQILNRLYIRFGDLKLRNPKNKAFAQMFQNNYAGKILECYLKQLNMVRVGGYLPDRVVNLILQYLSKSISRNTINNMLQPQLDVILFEIVFPIICFNDNDQRLWVDDPHEYVRKGYDIIEDLYSPRAASLDFVNELMRKRGQENLLRFIQFIVEVFKRYEESPPQYKPYFQKDGALLAIGSICEILKQTEPYKSELEHMLVKHVFPEFSSPVGHLRAKAAWVVGQYANINYSDPNNHRQAFHSVISGMRDHELPVRVDSVFALRSFIEASKDLNEIHAIMPQLLDELFKLMDETENEDLVFTLEIIVDKFGEEISPYALGLCQHLAAAVWKCIKTPEADNVGDEFGALAATGYLRAIGTILESVSQLPRLFMQIEPILLPIMRKMLTTGQEVYEETLDIVSYMTLYSPTISIDMWSLWPLMIEALEDWAIDFFPNILVPLDNYVSRGTAHFLTCVEPNYQMSLWNMISSILENKNLDDSDIKPAPKLIQVVFQNCKGQIDQWVEPYIRITVERLRRTELPYLKFLLMQVIADSLYYNASLTIGILSKLGVAAEIFNLWFQMLQQVKKSGARANFKREQQKKVCCLGLTSLIAIPGKQLPVDAAGHVLRATLDLLMAYKDQLAEADKEEAEADYDGMDVFQTDDGEEEDSYESNKEMGIDADKENEANNIQVRKLAAEAKFFRLQDEDTDDSDYDDNSDNDEVQTPIDEVDAFVFFVDSLKAVQASDPLRFQSLMQSLDAHYQGLCNEIAQDAEQRRAEIQKQCMEKGAPATDT